MVSLSFPGPTGCRYYYLRDNLQIHDEAELRIKLASLMIAAQVVGATISAAGTRETPGRGWGDGGMGW